MKIIGLILLLMIRSSLINLTIEDVLTRYCDVDTSNFTSITLGVGIDIYENIPPDFGLELSVIDILEYNQNMSYQIEDTQIVFLGAGLFINGEDASRWILFNIYHSLDHTRYWFVLYPANAEIIRNLENCGMYEVLLQN